jgi:UDP-glucose 4-epimerase
MSSGAVVVTGGAGFIGSHLVPALLDRGHEVAVVDDFSTGRAENLDDRANFYELDINDQRFDDVFETHRPNAVFMLAANTNVPRSVRDPVFDSRSVTGSLRTLELCRIHGVRKTVLASSSFVYGAAQQLPTPETEPVIAANPYVITKRATEDYARFYRDVYGIECVIFRLATTYGPGQVGGAMADYIRSIHRGGAAEIYGDGSKTRDYLYVADVVDAHLLALDFAFAARESPILNLGTGRETTLLTLYREVGRLLGRPDADPQFEPDRPGEITRSSLDSTKAAKLLGWRPRVSLVDGLAATIEQYVATLGSAA